MPLKNAPESMENGRGVIKNAITGVKNFIASCEIAWGDGKDPIVETENPIVRTENYISALKNSIAVPPISVKAVCCT